MKINPPKVPIHPTEDVSKNMNLFETYRDLRLRWKKSTSSRRKRLRIARKWRLPNNIFPMPEPTCIFVKHSNLPFTRTVINIDNLESLIVFRIPPIYH